MEKLKGLLRALFYRSGVVRYAIGAASVIMRRTRPLRVAHLLSYVETNALGPLQRPEALLLNAIAQVTLPRVVVEFGFFKGHSAFNFLQALGRETNIYSYDIGSHAAQTAQRSFGRFPNFHFLYKPQDQFTPSDIDHQRVEMVFFDAAHDLAINQRTWAQIQDSLSERCLVIVHDTGTWMRSDALAVYDEADLDAAGWLTEDEYQHQRGEREFVNWITTKFRDYSALHFHTLKMLRHGLTILQKNHLLPTAIMQPGPDSPGTQREGSFGAKTTARSKL